MTDAPRPCAHLLVEVGDDVIDLGAVTVDGTSVLAVLDGLLRLQLALSRHGARLRLREVAPDLAELLALVGFDVLLR